MPLIEASSHPSQPWLVSPALQAMPDILAGFSLSSASAPAAPDAEQLAELLRPAGMTEQFRAHQVHGADVLVVPVSGVAGASVEADAVVCTERGHFASVRTADCLPLLVARAIGDRVTGVLAIHAGWRGLVAGVIPNAVAQLRMSSSGDREIAALGPCIGPCCFEVGEDVASQIATAGGQSSVSRGFAPRPRASLPMAARHQLSRLDVTVPDLDDPPCTRCDPRQFPSYRRDGARAGRMTSFIGIRITARPPS